MGAIEFLKEILPAQITRILCDHPETEEIHLRADAAVCVTAGDHNTVCDYVTDASMLHRIFVSLCCGSVHAHEHTLRYGYVNAGEGIRVGVAGEMYAGQDHTAIRRVTSLNIRIPRTVRADGAEIAALAAKERTGILLFGVPGSGKTTLLRDVLSRLCQDPYSLRVSVIDTRGELCTAAPPRGVCDVLRGYEKAVGIEIATRSLDPQYVICDEIGSLDDARSILEVQNTGVPLIASAHGADLPSLLHRSGIRALFAEGVFTHAVRVWRQNGSFLHEIRKIGEDIS